MLDLDQLRSCELLALGRRSLELCARRLDAIAEAAETDDRPLRGLLRRMALDKEMRAADVERVENEQPEESRLPSRAEEAVSFIRGYLTSVGKRFGEGPLNRDVALFLAESLEEEASRLFRVLAGHSREGRTARFFLEQSECERGKLHELRDVVLEA
jgi:hypothetical protein